MGDDGHGDQEHGGHDPGHGGSHAPADVFTTTDDPDTRYMYRPRQVLVAESDLTLAWKELTLNRAEEVAVDERLRLRVFEVPDDAVPGIVRRFRSGAAIRAGANLVLPLGWHIACPAPPIPIKTTHELPSELPDPTTDEPVRVGLIDTGVADHDWLRGRIEKRYDRDDEVLKRDKDGAVLHGFGHGTFAASQICRHAPDATVVARRAVDRDGAIDDLTLARALLDLGDLQGPDKIDVLSLSMSGHTPGDGGLLATGEALRQLFEMNRELVVVVAAGNHASDRPTYPGAAKRVIAVGASDGHGQRAYFTNFGPWVDASLKGIGVEGAFPKEKNVLWPHTSGPRDYSCGFATWSGTSFTAPQVAGMIAQKLAGPNASTARDAVSDLIGNGPEGVTGLGTSIR